MLFYIVANTTETKKYSCDIEPVEEILHVKIPLRQSAFNFLCEHFNIKMPCINLEDTLMLSDTKTAYAWNICDEAVPGGFELQAVLDNNLSPAEAITKYVWPLVVKYLERFDD